MVVGGWNYDVVNAFTTAPHLPRAAVPTNLPFTTFMLNLGTQNYAWYLSLKTRINYKLSVSPGKAELVWFPSQLFIRLISMQPTQTQPKGMIKHVMISKSRVGVEEIFLGRHLL